MAYGNNPGPPSSAAGGGGDDLYSDAPEAPAQTDDAAAKEEASEGETALLPKSILMGKDFKVGEEVMLKIVAMHDDEIQVQYATEKGKDEEAGEGESAQAPAAVPKDAEMASMME